MKKTTLKRLYEISHLRPDNLVTPVILEYFELLQYFSSEEILRGMESG